MNPRRVLWLVGFLLAVALLFTLAGQDRATRPEALFAPLPLEAAPDDLKERYEQMKAIPGLAVLRRGGETYLLVMAGTAPEPGMLLKVAEVKQMGRDWRVLAVLEPGEGPEYPCAVVKVKAPPDATFRARLTGPDGEVRELKELAVPV